jgi:hypothetical protein
MLANANANANSSIVKECVELVTQYSQLNISGQFKPTLSIPLVVAYSTIHPKHIPYPKTDVAKKIIKFFERYSTEMYFVETLKEILESSLDNDDTLLLTSNEREKIDTIRKRLLTNHQSLIDNLSMAVDTMVAQVFSNLTFDEVSNEVIETIYICMKQSGLASVAAIREAVRPFVYVGFRLIERLQALQLLDSDRVTLIRRLNEDLKEALVGVRHEFDTKGTFNHLQTFGLVPAEGNNGSLQAVISKLLHVEIARDADLKVVSSLLKKRSMDSGTSTGILIFVSPHPDLYFNMNSLTKVTKGRPPSIAEGINVNKIRTCDIIKVGDPPTATASSVQTINVNVNTACAYILWTNNLTSFKWREEPVDAAMIKKILRVKPSQTIEQFNTLFESAIGSSREHDGLIFNRVKYMSFTDAVTEESFLDILTVRIVDYLLDQLVHVAVSALTDTIMTENFLVKLIETFDTAKKELGVPREVTLSAHCHIIYASIAMKAALTIKKDLLFLCTQPAEDLPFANTPFAATPTSDTPITQPALTKLVKLVVQSNDNIYSRVIASHYLHIA